MTAVSPIDFQLLERLPRDGEAATAWRNLLAQSDADSVFLLPEWLEAWQKTLGANQQVCYALGYLAGELVVAGGFTVMQRTIVFAGNGPSDYAGLLFNVKQPNLDNLISQLLEKVAKALPAGRLFRLGRIAAEGALSQTLLSGTGRYRGVISSGTIAPQMCMSRAGEVLRKKSLRRREGALRRVGPVQITTISDTTAIAKRLPDLFKLHQRRWESAGKQSQFDHEVERDFFNALPDTMAFSDLLRLTEVYCDDQVVAMHLGFSHNGVFTWYKPCFEPEFSRYSPGELLLKALIERAQEEGARIFDFTIGAEAFKLRFADRCPEVHYLNVTSSRALSVLLRVRQSLRSQPKAAASQ